MAEDRIAYLDLVKFTAMLLVCVGHCYVMEQALESSVRAVIYSFHMPLFMLLCGYFSSRSLEVPIRTLFIKKCKQLLVPVISCTVTTVCLCGGGICREIIGCVWFLKTLFACYLIARVAKYIKKPVGITFLLSWVALLIIPSGGTLMINFLYFYFCMGYLIHKYQTGFQTYRVALFCVSLFFFVIAVCMRWANPCDKVDLNLLVYSPMKFMIQLLVGFTGSIVVIGICELIYKIFGNEQIGRHILSGLSTVGRYTLGIYVVQTFMIERTLTEYVKWNEVFISSAFTDFVFIPLIGSVMCFVCYYVVRLTQPIKIINILFYGGQK